MTIHIPTAPPFDFANNLDYLTRSADECLYRVDGGHVYRLVPVGKERVLIRIEGDHEGLRLHIRSGRGDKEAMSAVSSFVREWFDCDRDLDPFYKAAEQDPLLNPVVKRFRGLRLIGVPDLFEAFSWAILGQQITLGFAYTLKKRFVETFGSSLAHEGAVYWGFPAPTEIAELSVDDLTPLQISSKKAEYIIGIANMMASGSLSKAELLMEKDAATLEKRLTRIRGIGPWTAHYVMMRCLRIASAFPIADVGLHNAIKKLRGSKEKPTEAELKQLAVRWSGYEAYAAFYLWRWLY